MNGDVLPAHSTESMGGAGVLERDLERVLLGFERVLLEGPQPAAQGRYVGLRLAHDALCDGVVL